MRGRDRPNLRKPLLLEGIRHLLEACQSVELAFVKPIFLLLSQTLGAKPIPPGDVGEGRLETVHVKSSVTAITQQKLVLIPCMVTQLTRLGGSKKRMNAASQASPERRKE